MNQPKQPNPALITPGGGYPPAGQPQAQQPQQQPGPGSGLVGPDGAPIQPQMIPLRLNPDGVEIPVPSMNPHELAAMLGGQLPIATAFTWVEVTLALSSRDAHAGWLERRIADLEAKVGLEPISFEGFMHEAQQQYEAAMAEHQQQQRQQQTSEPPTGDQGHGMPSGRPR